MVVAAFYFVMLGANGVLLPYLAPWLRGLGLTGTEIAVAFSVGPVLMLFVPPVWGFVADRSRRPTVLLGVACLGAALTLLPLSRARTFAEVVATFVLYGLFVTSISGLADAVAVVEARRIGTSYARLRLWGSLGFVVSSVLFSVYLERGGDPAAVVPVASACFALSAAITLAVPASPEAAPAVPSLADARRLVEDRAFLAFLGACAIHWASLAPFHLFYAIHLHGQGVGEGLIGAGLAAAVCTEVIVLFVFAELLQRVPLFALLAVAFLSGALRCAATASLSSGPALAAAQGLHGLAFGAFFAGSIAHLERAVPESLRATGRAVYGAAVFGLGGLVGNLLAGASYDRGGSAQAWWGGAALELLAPVALLLAARLARRPVALAAG